ncbi:alpha/beta hydrolase [Akkermansiaceae bacterium]|nr:alpha/beta hydrolase [Akkermansiaceae bacterium]
MGFEPISPCRNLSFLPVFHAGMKKAFLPVVLLAGLCVSLGAQQTSENNARLQQALVKFPDADANKDGVLTLEEAKTFKARMGSGKEAPGAEEGKADAGGRVVPYKTVGKKKLSLHIYEPEGHKSSDKLPAVVFFHGGGWRKGSPSAFSKQCTHLARRGMVAISVEYRLTTQPGVTIEDCVEDAKSAMRWVRGHAEELGIDPDRIASGGGSAGGHLGACVQLVNTVDADTDDKSVSAKPDAMILFNPAMALAPDPRMEKDGDASKERGSRLAESLRGEPSAISPLTFAKTRQPPCIMFFGTADFLLKPAEWFRDDSVGAGNSCRIVTYKDQGHSFFNREPYTSKTLAEVDKFLTDLGWLKAQ